MQLFALSLTRLNPALYVPLVIALGVCNLLLLTGKIPLGYNLRNLAVRWRTTLLTALAFTLVVALMIVMLAFINGMAQLTEQSGQPGNVIVLSDGATDELISNLGYSDSADVALQRGVLRDEHNHPMASREVYLVVNQPIGVQPRADETNANEPSPPFDKLTAGRPSPIRGEGATAPTGPGEKHVKHRFVQVRGLEDPAMAARVHGMELFPGGHWLSEAGVRRMRLPGTENDEVLFEAVLGEGVAGEMGKDRGKEQLEVGDVFDLGPRKWIVTGIMRSSGSTFGSEIWAKASLVGPQFGKPNLFTSMALRTAGPAEAAQLAASLKNYKKAALQAMTETEYFSKLSATNRQFLVAIVFVTVVMSIGGMFGVMNTMFAAIAQRTRDIGVLRLMGFARWQILSSFFIESLAIAVVGGIIGCALGSLSDGWTATSVVSGGQGGGKFVVLQLMVTSNTLAIGMLVTLLMGSLGGLLPAISAVRLTPLETLR